MEYKISELAQKAQVTKRTIHYYISKGLLMPPEGNGVNSLYNDEHIKRLALIKNLQAKYMPLNKIREYILQGKTDDTTLETTVDNIESQIIPNIYIKENICNIFEIHCSKENNEKYKHIIENVKTM